jgi:outer membrane protein OmpA-like peptidoglycan-associated protein
MPPWSPTAWPALAEQVTATVPGTDVLGAIQGAVDELRSGQLLATAPPTLAVVSNGLANTGALDLRQAFSGDASPKEVVHMLRATHDLPDLRGIHVDFYQLAQTTSEPFQQRRNRDWLESVWGAICADARAVRCEMDHEPAQRTGPRRTTPQDFRFWAPKPPEPDCLQAPTRCDLPSVLLFDPGSHQLRAGADGILRPIADRLRRTSERALVKGHTASWGSPAYRLDLSRRRASAVVERLVKLGVQHQQLRSTGVGSRERVANDLGPGGRLVEPQASCNRRVELVFQR